MQLFASDHGADGNEATLDAPRVLMKRKATVRCDENEIRLPSVNLVRGLKAHLSGLNDHLRCREAQKEDEVAA